MEEINIQNSVVREIHLKVLNDQNNKLFIKRDDLIHPYISGNKWRKLNYNVALCKESSFHGIITYGGAYSNHVIACAAACQLNKLKSIGYIRGDELTSSSNKVLRKCEELGMELIFMKRPEFDAMKKMDKTVHVNHETFLSIPEGGANLNGILGCMEILAETDNDYDIIALAQGTSTTSLGVLLSAPKTSTLLVIPVLKGYHSIMEMERLCENTPFLESWKEKKNQVKPLPDCHFGGYGKIPKELEVFIDDFKQKTGIPLDNVYTGKAMYGLLKSIKEDNVRDKRILFIHTGGIQNY